MTTRIARWTLLGLGLGLALGCGGDDSTDPQFTGTSARILVRDTTLLTGESANFLIEVQYIFGPGAPSNVFWTVTDTSVVELETTRVDPVTLQPISDGSAILIAKKPGTTKLTAFINKKFSDTSTVTVLATGAVKWRTAISGASLSGAAADDSDHVFVSADANLVSFAASGTQRWSTSGCFNFLSPSVREDNGAIITSGAQCTRRHATGGAALWTATVGSADNGAALTADDGAVVLSYVGTIGGTGAVIVSRFNSAGTEVWRDSLEAVPVAQKSTPAVSSNGDIYVPWHSDTGDSLVRLSGAGAVRVTVKLPAWAQYTSPAIDAGRVFVSYLGGITAFDTAGAVLWSASLGSASTTVSSPVTDATGNLYVQTAAGLYSFTNTGTQRWVADSLRQVPGPTVGSPSVVASGAVVVPCGGEVCAVNAADGSLVWRTALGGGVSSTVTVGSDGTIYASRQAAAGNELVALWSHAIPVLAGWPTEGHDMQRSRRQF